MMWRELTNNVSGLQPRDEDGHMRGVARRLHPANARTGDWRQQQNHRKEWAEECTRTARSLSAVTGHAVRRSTNDQSVNCSAWGLHVRIGGSPGGLWLICWSPLPRRKAGSRQRNRSRAWGLTPKLTTVGQLHDPLRSGFRLAEP